MIRFLSAVALGLFGAGCASILEPTIRAKECSQLCAQYLEMGMLQAAEDQCDLGIEFSPQYADLWTNKGIIALKRGMEPKAKEHFIKALRLNQHQHQAYNNLGIIYMNEGAYAKAHDNFQHALRVDPDYIQGRYNLALALKALHQNEQAKKELRTLLHVRPDVTDAWAQLGQIAMEEGQVELAIEHLSKATQLVPKFASAWLVLGNAFMEVGKPCEAKDSFSSCIDANQELIECRNNIIVADRKCKLQDRALEDVKGRAGGTKTPASEYAVALQAKEKGLVNEEERAYRRCLRYDPKYALCHFGLFELFKSRSDERAATVACNEFLKIASESDFRNQTAICRQYVGD